MLFVNRREQIKQQLLEHKTVAVNDLTELFNVSSETIRRDFAVLEKEGFLQKTHGGAVIRSRSTPLIDSNKSMSLFVQEKRRIASQAVSLLKNNDCIFLDHSTTCYYISEALRDLTLTVVTNSLFIQSKLMDKPNINLVATGGTFGRNDSAFFGINAINSLKNYRLDKTFMSARALDISAGMSDFSDNESELHRTAISVAREVILVADHTKFDKSAFVYVAEFDEIDFVITDAVLSDEWKRNFESYNITFFECL